MSFLVCCRRQKYCLNSNKIHSHRIIVYYIYPLFIFWLPPVLEGFTLNFFLMRSVSYLMFAVSACAVMLPPCIDVCSHTPLTIFIFLIFHFIGFFFTFFSFSASSVWLWIVVFPSKWLKDVQESQSVCKHRERSCAKSDSKGHHADHWLPPRLAHALKRADMAAKEIHHSGQRDWIKAPRKAVARKGKMKGKNESSHFLLIMICYFNNWIIITFFTSSGFWLVF